MSTMRAITMKWVLIPAITALLLSACSGVTSQAYTLLEAQQRASQLALGTVSLESTDQAVDAAAAAQLLPMWELLSDLGSSSSAAPEELAATVEAIEASMTADQLAAIDAMDLSADEVAEAGSAQAAQSVSEEASAQVTPQTAVGPSTASAMDPEMGGEMAASMGAEMPVEGGMPPGGSGQAPASRSTAAGTSSSGLYRDVIALLRSKAQS